MSDSVQVKIRVDQLLHRRLKELAFARGISLNELAREALEHRVLDDDCNIHVTYGDVPW